MSLAAIGPVSRSASAPVTPAASQAGFTVTPEASGAAPAGAAPTSAVPQTTPIAALMLALQEHAAAEAGDREARQHGQRLLKALAALQHALLSGCDGDALQQLSLLTDAAPEATDPDLARVIGSIRLRARVEVARMAAGMAAIVPPRPGDAP